MEGGHSGTSISPSDEQSIIFSDVLHVQPSGHQKTSTVELINDETFDFPLIWTTLKLSLRSETESKIIKKYKQQESPTCTCPTVSRMT